MTRPKTPEELGNFRASIAENVRKLRHSRGWTQAELARQLQLSQNRLSEIERGDGSFTAEQFLLLLKLFNVPATHFANERRVHELGLQNALARLGAAHLLENVDALPSEQLVEVSRVVVEALLDGSPRIVTSLAPVLVRNAERINLPRLHVDLIQVGKERRLAWIINNTVEALDHLLRESNPEAKWARHYRRAQVTLTSFLEFLTTQRADKAPLDILDVTIRSKRSLEQVKRSSSQISRSWGIVTSLQPEDFLQALRAARADN